MITKYGYIVMAFSTVFGIIAFLTGREAYIMSHK